MTRTPNIRKSNARMPSNSTRTRSRGIASALDPTSSAKRKPPRSRRRSSPPPSSVQASLSPPVLSSFPVPMPTSAPIPHISDKSQSHTRSIRTRSSVSHAQSLSTPCLLETTTNPTATPLAVTAAAAALRVVSSLQASPPVTAPVHNSTPNPPAPVSLQESEAPILANELPALHSAPAPTASVGIGATTSASASASIAPVRCPRRTTGPASTSQRAKVRTLSPVRLDVTNDQWKTSPLAPISRKLYFGTMDTSRRRNISGISPYLQHDTILSPTGDLNSVRIPKHDANFVPAAEPVSGPVADSAAPNQSSQINICSTPRHIPPPVNDAYLEEVISDPELELMPEHEDEPNLTVEVLPDHSTNPPSESVNLRQQQKLTEICQPSPLANNSESSSGDDGTIEETLEPPMTLPIDPAPESIAAPSEFTKSNKNGDACALRNTSGNEMYVEEKIFSHDQRNADLLDKIASVSDGFFESDVKGLQLEDKKERDDGHNKDDKDSMLKNHNVDERANSYTNCGIHVEDAANAARDDHNNNDADPCEDGVSPVPDSKSKSNVQENEQRHYRRRSSRNYPVRRGGSSAKGAQRSKTCSHVSERMKGGLPVFDEKSEQIVSDKERVSCVLTETKSSDGGNFGNNINASWQCHNSAVKIEPSKDGKEGVASDSSDEESIFRAKPPRPSLSQQKVKGGKLGEAKRRVLSGKAPSNVDEPGRPVQKRILMSARKGQNKQPGLLKAEFQSERYKTKDSDGEVIEEAIKARCQSDDDSDEKWDELKKDAFGNAEEGFETSGGSASEELVKEVKKVRLRRRCNQRGSTATESELGNGESKERKLLNNDRDEVACVTKNEEFSLKEECPDIMAKDDDPEYNSKLSSEERKSIVKHKTRGRGRPRGSRKNHAVTKVDKDKRFRERICKSEKGENTKSELLGTEEGGILPEQICANKQQVRRGRGRPRRMTNNPSKAKIDAEKDENYKCTGGLAESINSLHSSVQTSQDLTLNNNVCEENETENKHASEELEHCEASIGGNLEANQEISEEGKLNPTVHDKVKSTMRRNKGIACDKYENDSVKIVPYATHTVCVPSEVENKTVFITPIRKGRKKRKVSIHSSESKSNASSPPNDLPSGTRSPVVAGFGRTAEGRTLNNEFYMPLDSAKENGEVYAKGTPTRSSPRFRGKKRRILVVESETSYESPSANVHARRTHVLSERQHRELQGDDDINENGEEEGTDDKTKPSGLKKRKKRGVETGSIQRNMSKPGVGVRFTADGEGSQGRRTLKSQEMQMGVEEEDSKTGTDRESDTNEPPCNESSGGEENTPPRPTVRKRGRLSRRGASGKGVRGSHLGRKRSREWESAHLSEEENDGEHSGGDKSAKGAKRRKFMAEVLKLQKSLASAAWTDSREVEAQTEVKVIAENIPETIIQGVELAHPVTNTEQSLFKVPMYKGAKAKCVSSPKAKN